MHRLLMDTPDDLVCDHVNHAGLDNRKTNLRNCTTSQNDINRRTRVTGQGSCAAEKSSRFLGVAYDRKRDKWLAYIKKNGRQRNLGLFDGQIEAARARDAAARHLHGEFAALNFPEQVGEPQSATGRTT